MVGIKMGDFFILGNRVCIWKLNPAVLAPHKISLISHTSSRKNLLGPVARRDGGKLVHRSLCDSNDDTVHVSVSWTKKIECHCLKKNINNELCAFYFPLALHCLPFCNMSPQIVNDLFCSCQRRQIFCPAPMLALPQRQHPNDSPHHVRPPASHIMLIVTYFFLFLPTAGESSALPPCCGHPTANVPMTLPVTFITEGENLPQRTLKIDDNVASEDRRSRSTCCWMDRSRRSSLLTLCDIVLILLLIVNAGVVSSIPRLAPFDALIIDEGGGIVPAAVRRRCPLPSLLLLVPVKACRSLLSTAHFNENLVNARGQRLPRTTTTITPSVAVYPRPSLGISL
jgi:hypothetical protein